MHPWYAEYLDELTNQIQHLKRALEGLSSNALDWTPGEGFSSLAVLGAHVAGSCTYWISDVVGQHPSGRNRDAEFATLHADGETLLARLDRVLDLAHTTVEPLTLEDLTASRFSPRHNQERTITWGLFHALNHAAQHVGHAQITRQLYDAQMK